MKSFLKKFVKIMKKFLKKLLKILVVILGLFVAYYIFCLIRANLLVGDLAKAIEFNNMNEIEDLTGENFYSNDSIHTFNQEYMWDYEYINRQNDNFSYNKIGMKPYYNYILFEYEISFPDPSWIIENSPKAQEIINNFSEAYLVSARKTHALIDYFEGVYDSRNTGFSKFLVIVENVEDWWGNSYDATLVEVDTLNLKSIMKTVNQELDNSQDIKSKKTKALLAYNIFTNKFETDGIFYYAARGFSPAQEIVLKLHERNQEISKERYDDKNETYIYLSNGEKELCCNFYGDDLIWLSNTSGDDFYIDERNIYFLRNNIKKVEIIEVLTKEGYTPIERMNYYSANDSIEVRFHNDSCIMPEDLKGLSKDEVSKVLAEKGFSLED